MVLLVCKHFDILLITKLLRLHYRSRAFLDYIYLLWRRVLYKDIENIHFYLQTKKLIFSLMNDNWYLNKWYLNISGGSDGEYVDHPVS